MALNNGVWRIDNDIDLVLNAPVIYGIFAAASNNAGKRAVKYAREELKRQGADDTGMLSKSIKYELEHTALGPRWYIYSDLEYSRWVEDGTGIYGPYRTPITRPGGGVMVFRPGRRNSGAKNVGRRRRSNAFGGGGQFTGLVYSRTVQGQPAKKFIEKALGRITIKDFII